MKTHTRLRRGMTSLQAVILLGAGFLVVWGLMELFDGSKGAASTNTALTLRGEFKRPQGGVPVGGNQGGKPGGQNPGDAGNTEPAGPAKLPNGDELIVEQPGTKFDVPGHDSLTDNEIGAAQAWADKVWGLAHILADVSIIPGPVNGDAIIDGGTHGVFMATIRDRAEAFAKRYAGPPGEWNALQHSYWQAQLAFHYGSGTAQVIGDQHESLQQYGNVQRRRDSAADLFNNQVGRDIGQRVRVEAAGAGPEFDPNQRMMELIREAIRDGRLDLGGGVGGAGVGNPHGQNGLRLILGIEPKPLQVPNPFWKG